MSCSSCKEIIDPDIPFAVFDYMPTQRFEQSSQIRIPHKPSKGWTVVLPVKGSPQTVSGPNPRQVVHEAVKLLKLNGFQVDKNALWFNCNVQWLQRTPPKYHLVTLGSLLKAAEPQEVTSTDVHAVAKTSPDVWASHFWNFIKIYLESDTYSWEVFFGFLKQYHKMLNPAENALLGSSSWYVRFTLALDKLERNPAYQAEKARDWLNHEIHF